MTANHLYPSEPDKDHPDCACAELVGKTVSGIRGGQWTVIERLNRKKNSSGGNFSVGYIVENRAGRKAFMKATDTNLIGGSAPDAMERIFQASSEHGFERQMLDICQGNDMDKIVHALDYGSDRVIFKDTPEFVFYIMFELAEGDTRSAVVQDRNYDFIWTLHSLHNLAVAVKQLHSKNVAHNDIKPSNVLIFSESQQKLADMGRATHTETFGPHDKNPCPGDKTYAAPEQLYKLGKGAWDQRVHIDLRKASDLYMLGSMGYFFVTGAPITSTILKILKEEQSPIDWTGSFEEILPYWTNAFGIAMQRFNEALPKTPFRNSMPACEELATAIKELCNPNPAKRGHPSNVVNGQNNYSVEKYISKFDSLLHKFQILMPRK